MTFLHERIESDEYWQDSQRMPKIPLLALAETIVNNSISVGIGQSPLRRTKKLFFNFAEEGFDYRQAEDGQELASLLDEDGLVRVVEDHRIKVDRFGEFMFGKTQTDPLSFERKGIDMLSVSLYAGKLVRRMAQQSGDRPYLLERQVSYLVPTSLGGIAAGSSSYELNMPSNVATGVYLPSHMEVATPYDRSKGKSNDNIKIVRAGVIIPKPKNKFRIGKPVKQS